MRAAIFIDGGYLIKQLQDAKVTPDYVRLAEFLLKPLRRNIQLDLMRCYFYYCPPWMSEKPTEAELRRMAGHERFMAEIQEGCDRWQVRLGKLERRREGDKEVFAQKRVDVQLSVDLVQHTAAGHIQHAVLVAGDSDFIPAIVAAKESGTTLTLWCDRDRSVHRDLLKLADEVHYIRWKDFPSRAQPERGDQEQRGEQARREQGNGEQPRREPNEQGRSDEAGRRPQQQQNGRGRGRHQGPRREQPLPTTGTVITSVEAVGGEVAELQRLAAQPEPTGSDQGLAEQPPTAAAGELSEQRLQQLPEDCVAPLRVDAPAPMLPEEPAVAGDASAPKNQRGRRGSGRGRAQAAAATSDEQTAAGTPELVPAEAARRPRQRSPVATDSSEDKPAAPATGRRPPRTSRKAPSPEQASSAETQPASTAGLKDEKPSPADKTTAPKRHEIPSAAAPRAAPRDAAEPGDDIGNLRDAEEAQTPAKSRRRRGGRGRRRKGPAGQGGEQA